MRHSLAIGLGSAALVLLSATPALAGGSDSPTPYVVGADGLTLPAGTTFPDNGHVNIRYTMPGSDAELAAGVHFESLNDQPSGQFVGQSFLPWSYLIEADEYCITWVQVADFNEHFGEGGQEPVCTDGSTTTTDEVEELEEVEDLDEPGDKADDETDTDETDAGDTTEDGDTDVTDEGDTTDVTGTVDENATTDESTTDDGTDESTTTDENADVTASDETDVVTVSGDGPVATAVEEAAPAAGELAHTGATALPVALAAGGLVLAGATLLVLRARRAASV